MKKSYPANGVTYRLPNNLNEFQNNLYIHLINWKWENISKEAGIYRSREYDAILPDSFVRDGKSPLIYQGIADYLESHRAKNNFRIHQHFYHMASSQAANINLFLPILHHSAVNSILGTIKSDFASLATQELDNGYCLEFWGGNYNDQAGTGLLGDKSAMAGTDSDMAIAYYNHTGELCLWLIEHKLTEKEFTNCGGFKSKGKKPQHDCTRSFSEILKNKTTCYYHDVKKFKYWDLIDKNRDFFINHQNHSECPFRGGMITVGQPERITQNRVIALLRDELHYCYLGDWKDRDGNSNIEEGLLTAYLTRSGYSKAQISKAIYSLKTEADNHSRGLYGNNMAVYSLLRYGVPVKTDVGKVTETVHLINWVEPEKNDFALAEEVTLHGNHERRPDIVLYVNVMAVGVIELKNSRLFLPSIKTKHSKPSL